MALWIGIPAADLPPENHIAVFRGEFSIPAGDTPSVTLKFSADERCQLFLDGKLIADGPERGCPQWWYFREITIHPSPGKHTLCARVLCFGKKYRAAAQMSVRHGFHLADSELEFKWSYQLENLEFELPFPDWGSYPRIKVPTAYNAEIFSGRNGCWRDVEHFTDARILHAPDLPPMRCETVVPQEIRPGLYRFDEYVIVNYTVSFKGKGRAKIRWTECPYLNDDYDDVHLYADKGNRDGSVFIGNYDVFDIDGEVVFPGFFWRAGRWIEVETTGTLEYSFDFVRTGYPLPPLPEKADQLSRMACNTLRNCTWETFMDCPYYEQLMYVGDARVESLCLYHLGADRSIIRKALRMFALGIREDGSLHSQYPSKNEQNIPAFSVTYILMVHDYFKHCGKDDLINELLPHIYKTASYLLDNTVNGLWKPEGWGFVDWCRKWKCGDPAPGEANAPLNMLRILALEKLADISGNNDCLAAAAAGYEAMKKYFWDAGKGLFADNAGHTGFSEHSQILALLSSTAAADHPALLAGLQRETELIPCGIYFSCYYLMVCKKFGLTGLAARRLADYEKLTAENLTTLPEEFTRARSDCHAWSSHILFNR